MSSVRAARFPPHHFWDYYENPFALNAPFRILVIPPAVYDFPNLCSTRLKFACRFNFLAYNNRILAIRLNSSSESMHHPPILRNLLRLQGRRVF